jgi:predicted restriction endonuclease
MSAYSKAEIREMFCWACGSDARIELHHLRPQRAGGCDERQNIVPLCFVCHSLVDRVPLVSWPIDDWQRALIELQESSPVMRRLFLKMAAVGHDYEANIKAKGVAGNV